jgi:segregation and condensation protein A
MESQAPRVTVEGFDGPLDLLLELVEERKLDILTVRLGDLADAYLARVRAMAALPADEVSAFLALASRLVLLKARSLLPSLEPIPEEDAESEEELRARLLEYAVVRERASALGARLRSGERAFHREGGTVELPPRGGEVDALALAFGRVLALASRQREEDIVAPGERYSVEQRTAEIEALVGEQVQVSFARLLGDTPTVGFAVVTFIALLDLYRRGVIDLGQDELFADIVITRREATSAQT